MPLNPAAVLAPAPFVPRTAISFGGDGAVAIAVDEDHPLPIASAAPATGIVTIPAGSSLSAAIDLGAQRVHRIVVPIGWTAAAITFQASADGIVFGDLCDATGETALAAAVATAGRHIVVDPAVFLGVRHFRLRSGTAAAPVAQAAPRDITLVTVAR